MRDYVFDGTWGYFGYVERSRRGRYQPHRVRSNMPMDERVLDRARDAAERGALFVGVVVHRRTYNDAPGVVGTEAFAWYWSKPVA